MSATFTPRILERYVAIDQACGWPNLTLLPTGDIVTLIWPEPCHGLWEGAAECWASTDGGRTWAKRGVPVPHAPGTNRMNLSAGLARDGALVACVAGWGGRGPRGTRTNHLGCPTQPPISARSTDGGRTWENFATPTAPAAENRPNYADGPSYRNADGSPMLTPFGDLWPLPDGTLGVMFYSSRALFYVSPDEGRSWIHRGNVGEHDATSETTWLPLPDGRLLAMARTHGDNHLDQFISTDNGLTWKFDQAVTGAGEHPAGLTALRDGTLLLTYGIRTEALFGVGAKISHDAGRTWSQPQVLVNCEESTNPHDPKPEARDGGYPANVALADGTIVTAYYCKGVRAHQRYHVGVIRWRLG